MKRLCLLMAWQALCLESVFADQGFQAAPAGTPNQPVSASARLDFITNIDKYLFFRVGTGAYPTASATIDTVAFALTPSIPAAPTTPVNGNSISVNWNAASPAIGAPTSVVLPVEVQSNAGQITIRATATTALTSGANTIPLSSIVVTSSDANLPAPLVPNAGTGASVNVTGSAFTNLVTNRAANWTFAYNNAVVPSAGVYTGQITFTASAP